jgi:hypothetical protein
MIFLQDIQGKWITECIKHMTECGLSRIEPTREAEVTWRNLVLAMWNLSLLREGKSWWNGANVPGEFIEPLYFSGGVGYYAQICKENMDKGYEGFHIV